MAADPPPTLQSSNPMEQQTVAHISVVFWGTEMFPRKKHGNLVSGVQRIIRPSRFHWPARESLQPTSPVPPIHTNITYPAANDSRSPPKHYSTRSTHLSLALLTGYTPLWIVQVCSSVSYFVIFSELCLLLCKLFCDLQLFGDLLWKSLYLFHVLLCILHITRYFWCFSETIYAITRKLVPKRHLS
jgi:hypothetical protein